MLLSPSLTLLPCFTKCLASSGATSSLLWTLNEVTCFFLNPSRFFVPVLLFITGTKIPLYELDSGSEFYVLVGSFIQT